MAQGSQGSPKPNSKRRTPKARRAPVAKHQAGPEGPQSLIWLGPVIRGPGLYVNNAQTFRGEDSLAPKFREMIAADPEARGLLVPVALAGQVMDGIKAGGSDPAAMAFARTAEKYKRAVPGQEGGS